MSVNRARKSVILSSTVLMCFGIQAAMVKNSMVALGLIAVVMFGFRSWISNVQSLASDYFPEEVVGAVTGMGGVAAGLGCHPAYAGYWSCGRSFVLYADPDYRGITTDSCDACIVWNGRSHTSHSQIGRKSQNRVRGKDSEQACKHR